MPDAKTVDALIETVEKGDFLGAIERFYAEDASMQENQSEPRRGRATLLEHERKLLASMKAVRGRCVGPLLRDGDSVVIPWAFEFEGRDGKVVRMEELAQQTWRGEQILRERFFYDPAQLRG
jgi:hypothetical protein